MAADLSSRVVLLSEQVIIWWNGCATSLLPTVPDVFIRISNLLGVVQVPCFLKSRYFRYWSCMLHYWTCSTMRSLDKKFVMSCRDTHTSYNIIVSTVLFLPLQNSSQKIILILMIGACSYIPQHYYDTMIPLQWSYYYNH